jgi:hypothetical protein
MRQRAARTVAVCTALLAGAPIVVAAQTVPPAKAPAAPRPLPVFAISLLEDDMADTASRLCPDVLSGKAKLPAPGTEAWWRGYRLREGLPKAAMDALGRDGISLISRATLAHGSATDGDFVVALGGSAGETCRLIVYRAVPTTGLAARISTAMAAPKHGWKALPVSQQPAAADKLSLFLRRDGKPYLANLLTPKTPGPVALAIVVAAVPPHVTLPQGF